MLILPPLLLLVFPAAVLVVAHGAGDLQGFSLPGGSAGFDPTDPCLGMSPPCMGEADRYSLEALRSIHHMMDDDKDGGIEVEESMEFIIEDMKQQQTHKHSNLHREDQHITVEELWRGWKSSEVHNWTQEDVLRWLKEFVELPQYEKNFKDFKVNGNTLPRIAANEPSFLSGHLRIQDQRDKQKISIKALDVVLFGPPTRPPHNYMKDLLLIVSVVMGVGGCWFAQAQNKASKVHISKMMKDLESLQTAEQSLMDLQEQLERAQEEKRNVAEEKHNLEEKMRDEIMGAQEEAYRLHELRQGAVTELSRLRYAEEELEQVRGALKQAEKDIQASWTVSEVLQQWLQLTHEVEVQYYNVKKHSAELQLTTAKEEAERIKKKRSSLLGTLHVAHSSSLDQVDQKILEAKNALSEVTACLRERLHRWQQIERLCGFRVIRNAGLSHLSAQLYSENIAVGLPRVVQPPCSCHSSAHGSIEDLMEESAPQIMQQMQVKRSPRTQGSTICRARRPCVIAQPPVTAISADPDLLVPIRAPYACFEEDDTILLKTLKKQDSQEKFTDSDYMTSAPLTKMYHGPTVDPATQKLYYDEAELLADACITKVLSKEVEAIPVRKISAEDLDCRKMAMEKLLDPSLETHPLNMPKEDPLMEVTSRKISQDRMEYPMDVPMRKGLPSEMEVEFPSRKVERDMAGDLMDPASRNLYRERSDLPLEIRKLIWNELEATDKQAQRNIPRDTMGPSYDSASRKIRDDAELLLESMSRRFTRDSMGMSLDTGTRKLQRSKVERPLDSSVRALVTDKMVETVPLRKISRDEMEYTASLKLLPREKFDAPPSTEKQEFVLDAANRRMLRNELEPVVAPPRRSSRMSRDVTDSSADNPPGNVDIPSEVSKHILKEEIEASESSQGPFVQPDLMVTSQVPWTTADLYSMGPLSQLVYDGILEKSCSTMTAVPATISASTPNLPQKCLLAEMEPRVLPPKAVVASAPDSREEKTKDKEKSKKSMKLKSIFKKKPEATQEKPQSGLQKL